MIQNLAEIIVKDPKFINEVKTSLELILKDNKIDMNDIPQMLILVVNSYNKLKKFTVSINELPELLNQIVHLIIDKYDLVDEQSRTQFDKILQSSINLVLLMPNVRKGCLSCFPCLKK